MVVKTFWRVCDFQLQEYCVKAVQVLMVQNNVLANHPNSNVYRSVCACTTFCYYWLVKVACHVSFTLKYIISDFVIQEKSLNLKIKFKVLIPVCVMPFWHCFSSSDRFLFSVMCIIYKLAIAKIIHDCRVFWKLMLFVVVFFLFRMLSGFVEFDGYYLESDPCLVCNNPEVPFQVWLSLFIYVLCSPSSAVFRDFTQQL